MLIDRYLDGTLSGLELQKFMERLDSDEKFRATVSMQNLLIEGIVRCADKELQENLLSSLAYRKPRVPMGLKLIITFLFVTIAGISLWNYIGTDSSKRKKSFLSFSWLSGSREHSGNASVGENQPDNNKSEKPYIEESKVIRSSTDESGTSEMSDVEDAGNIDTITVLNSNQDLNEVVVKKDQLLISQSLFIQDDSVTQKKNNRAGGSTQPSLSENVAEKLNPAAGLENPEIKDHKSVQLLVEFWISPINYRGYKMYRNKLVLFGMEEPDAIQLFRRDGKLYMRHLNDYFLLEPTEEFTSYQSVKDKEFSSQLTK